MINCGLPQTGKKYISVCLFLNQYRATLRLSSYKPTLDISVKTQTTEITTCERQMWCYGAYLNLAAKSAMISCYPFGLNVKCPPKTSVLITWSPVGGAVCEVEELLGHDL